MRLSVAHRYFRKKVLSCAYNTVMPAIDTGAECVRNLQSSSKVRRRLHVNIGEVELRDAVWRHLLRV
jgi:hypothetical protein